MQVFHSNHQGFNGLLACFSERPEIVPAFSIIVGDSEKPIALICIYKDANVCFLHGLFKSKFADAIEFSHALKFSEDYLANSLGKLYSIVALTNKNWLRKIFTRNDFICEEAFLYHRRIS